MNYDGRTFVSVENTSNGEVSSKTYFEYKQEGDILTASYSGGDIIKGMMVGIVKDNGEIVFNYNHVNTQYEIRGGSCVSTPVLLADGRIRLHEKWQWNDRDRSEGESVVEEVVPEPKV